MKLKRFSLYSILLFTLLASVSLFAPSASANTQILTTSCATLCSSFSYFNHASGMQGTYTQMTTSKAVFGGNIGYWLEDIAALSGTSLNKSAVITGFEQSTGSPKGYCQSRSNTLYWFAIAYDSFGDIIDSRCYAVPSQYLNTNGITVFIGPYVSNGGGMQAVFADVHGVTITKLDFPTSLGTPTSFQNNWYQAQLQDNPVLDPDVQLGYYIGNSYYKNGQWNLQVNPASQTSAQNPPQFYWAPAPSPGNVGGILYYCAYSTGAAC